MTHEKHQVTTAIRALRAAGVTFTERHYDYVEKGGTTRAASCLGVDEHQVVKTLLMEDEAKRPLVVLMHGDREVSTKQLARELGVKTVHPCTPERARSHTGYVVGGTSPFGTRKQLPVYVERSILELERIFINAGYRGFLVEIAPQVLLDVLHARPVSVGIP